MKPTSVSLALLIALQANSQTTPLQQIAITTGTARERVNKTFSIQAGKDSVKQGRYEESHGDANQFQVAGQYQSNQKDGVWERKYKGRVVSRKQYKKGERVGNWEFFNQETPDFQYDPANNAVFNLQEDTAAYYYYTTAGTWVKDQLDITPTPLMSKYEWLGWMSTKLRYPYEAIDKNIQGKVLVEMTIDEYGNVINYQVSAPAHPLLDQEALRLVKEFGFEFVPALKNGMKVRTKFTMPVVFKLQE
ncbi:energy transducer TonB [Paraflavitalea pollutisoli]|uniref:energy transducer TonB n=1 Tax=Paraflavitalea pollutisoli TaxID=3034143 RepID=UPI0023ECF4A8|nr:energy transducer TonB [Paraflavitalea sp. H1-2-19X]